MPFALQFFLQLLDTGVPAMVSRQCDAHNRSVAAL
jgi:hypothetical protein